MQLSPSPDFPWNIIYQQMDQQALYKKIIQCSNKNRKALSNILELVGARRKEYSSAEHKKYQNYLREYEELLKFNKESEEENYRLKKELALIDIEIEEFSFRNQISRSRIKDQADQMVNIKDETIDIDKQKRREQLIKQECSELEGEKQQLQNEISQLEEHFDRKRKSYQEIQEQSQQTKIQKEYLSKLHSQNQGKQQSRIDQLQAELKSIKGQISQAALNRQKQSKTKRNSRKLKIVGQLLEEVQKTKSHYDRIQ